MITKDNFFKESYANFKEIVNASNILGTPNFISPEYRTGWFDISSDFDNDNDFIESLNNDYELISQCDLMIKIRYKTGKTSSKYWYTNNGVFRLSNHWGKCRNCFWTLDDESLTDDNVHLGFCKWSDFKSSEELESDYQKRKMKEQYVENARLSMLENFGMIGNLVESTYI